jgi:uncharacterized cupredoxin-like copper-binding protein
MDDYQRAVRINPPKRDPRRPSSAAPKVTLKGTSIMKSTIGGTLAATLLLALATTAFAATQKPAPHLIHVSLLGEADQPMSVKLDMATVKAGPAELMVSNDAVGTDHEVVLVKLKNKNQTITADAKKHRVNESALDSLGEVAGLAPGEKGTLKVKLSAGEYMLLCNHKSHYELGMATHLTVTN